MPQLENWDVRRHSNDPYLAPECWPYILHGTVSGHPELPDDRQVQTSRLVRIDWQTKIAVTSNRTYQLGTPAPAFVESVEKNYGGVSLYLQGLNKILQRNL